MISFRQISNARKIIYSWFKPSYIGSNFLNCKQSSIINHAPKLYSDVISSQPNIPEYLYHFTTSKAYSDMLKSGIIRTSQIPNGVYCIERNNFINFWSKLKIHNGTTTAQNDLLKYLGEKSKEIVVLRIPTQKLKNLSDIKIRSQNFLFQREIDPRSNPVLMKHLIDGVPVNLANSYISQGHSIEYIIPEVISMSNVELAGRVSLNSENIIPELERILL